MVLTIRPGGAASAGRAPIPRAATGARGESGSQALEFALVVPLLGLLLGLLAQTGLLLADVVVAHGVAREVGRTAAVDGDDRARAVAGRVAGGRDVRVDVGGDDEVVEARVELATRAFAAVGVRLWLPARAVFRREGPGDVRGGR